MAHSWTAPKASGPNANSRQIPAAKRISIVGVALLAATEDAETGVFTDGDMTLTEFTHYSASLHNQVPKSVPHGQLDCHLEQASQIIKGNGVFILSVPPNELHQTTG
jgi:hypothetical protein